MQETSTTLLSYAKQLIDSGFAVYPCYGLTTKNEAKRKAAMMKKESPYYGVGVPYDIFEKEYYRQGVWIGVRCGKVSGNLECLDFDNKFGDAKILFDQFMSIPEVQEIVEANNLFIENTVSGGVHLCYKTIEELTLVDGGGKIARRHKEDTNEVIALIETRTEGQYFVTAPSDGYEVVLNSLQAIVPISLDDRNFLIEMAKSMDEYLDVKRLYAPQQTKGRISASSVSDLRPGEHFDSTDEAIEELKDMLLAEGWTNPYANKWCRPNKTDGGISATLGHVAPNVFYVFSSNAYPFEQGKCYTPFSALTLLHYNGDFSECAKSLSARGYGKQFKAKQPTTSSPKKHAAVAKEILRRTRRLQDLTEADIEHFCKQSGMQADEAMDLFRSLAEETPYLLGFDFLMHFEKLSAFIGHCYSIHRNSLTRMVTIYDNKSGKEVNENDVYIQVCNSKMKAKKEDINSLLSSSFVKDINPLSDYFSTLPSWKESDPDYVKMYASYFKCKNPEHQEFFEEMFKKHLVRSLYCSLNGIENRYCLVLLGEQDDGKSTFIRKLCFDERYYTQKDITDGQSKDNQIAMYENFMWQFEEIDSYNPQQVNKLKSAISTGYDKTRDVYGRKAEYRVRVVNFWASGNKDEILTDETGNTRFLVFRGKITSHDYNNHLTGVVKVPLESLWSQVYYLYQKGREFYDPELTKSEKTIRDEINVSYEVSNDVEGHLKDLFELGVAGGQYWSAAKIVRFLSRRKIYATMKQVNYAIDKLIRKEVWAGAQTKSLQGTKHYLLSIKRSADVDFDFAPPADFNDDKGEDLPF